MHIHMHEIQIIMVHAGTWLVWDACMHILVRATSSCTYMSVRVRVCVWARVLVCACGYVFKLVLSTQARAYIHTHTRSCACACACWCTRREHVREKSERWLPLVSSPGNSTCSATWSAACRWACSTPSRRFGECTCFDALCISSSSPPPLSACLASFPSVFDLSLHPPPPRCIWISNAHTRACMHVCACTHTHTLNHAQSGTGEYTYVCLFVYICLHTCAHTSAHMHVYWCVLVCECMHLHSYFCVHICILVFLCTYMNIPVWKGRMVMYTCICTCMYMPLLPAPSLRMHACALTCARAHTRAKPIVVWCIWYTSACIHVSMHIRIIMHLQPWHVYLYMIYMICMLLYTHMYIHACNVCYEYVYTYMFR